VFIPYRLFDAILTRQKNMETEWNIALLMSPRGEGRGERLRRSTLEYKRFVNLATRLDDLTVLDSNYDLNTCRNC